MTDKKVILDTNILLDTPDIIKEFGHVVLPLAVLKELDKHKFKQDTGYAARAANRTIEKCMRDDNIVLEFDYFFDPQITNDENIIKCALRHNAKLITKDLSMTFIAKSYKVDYEFKSTVDNLDFEPYVYDSYSNYNYPDNGIIEGSDIDVYKQYIKTKHDIDIKPWSFIIQNKENAWIYFVDDENEVIVNVSKVDGLNSLKIDNGQAKFKPKDIYQQLAMFSIMHSDCSFISGTMGTGKTLVAMASALAITSGKIYILRPPLKKKTYDTGFLPGSKDEKMEEYISGFISALYFLYGNTSKYGANCKDGECYSYDYVKEKILPTRCEILTINTLHGLSLQEGDTLIVDEVQLLDREYMQLLLSRVGNGAKLIMTGDINQTYSLLKTAESGVASLMRFLPHKEVAFVKLNEIYRNKALTELAMKITE